MLSRVADSLYWMARYMERAEHTSRLIAVKLESMIEQTSAVLHGGVDQNGAATDGAGRFQHFFQRRRVDRGRVGVDHGDRRDRRRRRFDDLPPARDPIGLRGATGEAEFEVGDFARNRKRAAQVAW